jgi:hypothetical protein
MKRDPLDRRDGFMQVLERYRDGCRPGKSIKMQREIDEINEIRKDNSVLHLDDQTRYERVSRTLLEEWNQGEEAE